MTLVQQRALRSLWRDVAIIGVSLVVAVILVRTGTLDWLIGLTPGLPLIDALIAGLFFTSIFTTIPAVAMLGEIGQHAPIVLVALTGALGALIGDLVLFRFVRDRLADDLLHVLNNKERRWLHHVVDRRLFHWLTPLVAAAIIASPLPDELAMAVLGSAKFQTRFFVPFSFVSNFVGILLIGWLASRVV